MSLIPAKTKASISKTSTERLKLALQHYRTENKSLKEKIDELQSKIKNSSMEISAELGDDIVTPMSVADQFFWEEQQKYLKLSSTGISYHPVIIRYCLSPAAKSSRAYDETRCAEKKLLVSQFSQVAVVYGITKIISNQNEDLI